MNTKEFEKYCSNLVTEHPEHIEMLMRSSDRMQQAYALLI
ncbi:hypothetical protein SAMN04488587_1994 [Methanococcoides vulcani]|uniref:Uncharacterized protein n=1 Tax=Methanococcoides vulcani TaxID=1353158 RepID=A0A1I0B6A4_9EURY|nr:hypothetical protein SAMN04488587_1994 [Methanococcoides vulcani]